MAGHWITVNPFLFFLFFFYFSYTTTVIQTSATFFLRFVYGGRGIREKDSKKKNAPPIRLRLNIKLFIRCFFSTPYVRALKIVGYFWTSALFEISLHADIHRHEQQVLFRAKIEYSRDGNLHLNIPLRDVNKPTALTLHTCDRIWPPPTLTDRFRQSKIKIHRPSGPPRDYFNRTPLIHRNTTLCAYTGTRTNILHPGSVSPLYKCQSGNNYTNLNCVYTFYLYLFSVFVIYNYLLYIYIILNYVLESFFFVINVANRVLKIFLTG